jgi:hypothetical protein
MPRAKQKRNLSDLIDAMQNLVQTRLANKTQGAGEVRIEMSQVRAKGIFNLLLEQEPDRCVNCGRISFLDNQNLCSGACANQYQSKNALR